MKFRLVVDDWNGHAAIVVASGPSAGTEDLAIYRGRAKFIAVNDSWKLAPWADILFACDPMWWDANDGCKEFKGRRVTASPNCMKKHNIELFCSTGTNSGLRALYLAQHLGANPICMVGFDMHPKNGIHWHPERKNLRTPGVKEMMMWRNETEWAAARFHAKGVRVVNCTPGSALTKYLYMPLARAFNEAGDESPTDKSRHSIVA